MRMRTMPTMAKGVTISRRTIGLLLCLIALLVILPFGALGLLLIDQNTQYSLSPDVAHARGSTVIASRAALSAMRSASDKILGIGRPVRLVIAAIDVNAPVEAVEILSNGELATPGQSPWNDVGWYEPGPRPGNPGSAVIDGHLDRPGGYPAVFWRLRDLHVGDSVVVIDAYGKTVRFAVRRVVFYSAETAPFEDIFGSQGGIQLNLITCAGDWIPEQHQTALRLVVYTSLA
jgi:hypothetical protein